MNAKKHETYILNTLSYLHLLPSNKIKKHSSKILQYIYSKKLSNGNNNAQHKLATKALAIIDKHIKEQIHILNYLDKDKRT